MSGTAPGAEYQRSISGSPDLEIPLVTPDTCIAVEFHHQIGGIPKSNKFAFIQMALLYTTPMGHRRLRVSTLAIRASSSPTEVFRSADFGALTAMITKRAVLNIQRPKEEVLTPLRHSRSRLSTQIVQALAEYRKNTNAADAALGQLILPDKLQLLPLFAQSMVKSAMLRPSLPSKSSGLRAKNANPSADDRAFALWHGARVTPTTAVLRAHVNVFPLLDLKDGEGDWIVPPMPERVQSELEGSSYHACIRMPQPLHASITRLKDDLVFLIDDGLSLYIYVGPSVSPQAKKELFTASADGGCTVNTTSDLGKRALRLIWQCRRFCNVGGEDSQRPTFPPVIVVFARTAGSDADKDPFDETIMGLMVADATGGELDYLEYLRLIHKRVRANVKK